MLRGYRLYILAFGLILSAASPQPSGEAQPPQADRNGKIEQALADIARSQRESVEPSVETRPCKEGEDNRQSDLCAQWKAADAASHAAMWAMISTLVAIAGTVGVLLTLKETRRTANAAINAVAETEKGNLISRETMERQLRPYLYVQTAGLDISHMPSIDFVADTGTVSITFRNYGHTPAKNIQLEVKWDIVPEPAVLEPWKGGQSPVRLADLAPGESAIPFEFAIGGISKRHRELSNGDVAIVIDGRARYSAASGPDYETNFRFVASGQEYFIKPPTQAQSGNYAS